MGENATALSSRTKVLCSDDVWRTFVLRGKYHGAGFVRVKGRTVSGWREPVNNEYRFVPNVSGQNANLLSASA